MDKEGGGDERKNLEKMEEKLERLEVEMRVGNNGGSGIDFEEEGRGRRDNEVEEWKERIKKLERKWEAKEKGDKKRNIIMKRMKEGEKGIRDKVEDILKKVGVVKVKEIRRIGADRREKEEMVIVKLESEEMKRRIVGINGN